MDDFNTGSAFPTFSIVKPTITNTRVDMSPYGQSVFADAVDAIQAVDLTFDALVNEVDVSKMRVFLSDVMFYKESTNGKSVTIPFGKQDCTVCPAAVKVDLLRHGWRVARTARAHTRSVGGRAAARPEIDSTLAGQRQGLATQINSTT